VLDGHCKDRIDRWRPSFLFSQTVGPDRGLEDLMAALPNFAARQSRAPEFE
jgi:hypothetical protein